METFNLKEVETISHQYCSEVPMNGCDKEKIKQYYLKTYQLHEALFELISQPEAFYLRAESLRHPLIFYYGHTAAFYMNKLTDRGIITERINPRLEAVLAVGVDEMKWDDLNEAHYDWPSVDEVKEFRRQVNDKVLEAIDKVDEEISWTSDMWVIMMTVEHERVHLQTSAVIIRKLDIKYIKPSKLLIDCPIYTVDPKKQPKNALRSVPACQFSWKWQLDNADTYGWDNQFGNKKFDVKEFKASQMLVSNGEYLEFIKEGAYSHVDFWDNQGKQWLKETSTTLPAFWIKEEERYLLRTMNQIIALPLDWPVEINGLEAHAFCNWKSKHLGKRVRLPTEDEYFSMYHQCVDQQSKKNWNKNFKFWFSPCPVNMFKFGDFYDITGNVWNQTKTKMYMLEGSEPHPLYEDYSIPACKDGKHNMIVGNSFASIGGYSAHRCRNFFRRHFHQFAGFRYVEAQEEDEQLNPQKKNIHSVHDLTAEKNLELHYARNSTYLLKILEIFEKNLTEKRRGRSLVIGCSAGRLVLELTKFFNESIGTDYVVRYFGLAEELLEKGFLIWNQRKLILEDFCPKKQNAQFKQMNPENPDKKKIHNCDFIVLDGLNLRPNTISSVLKATKSLKSQECSIMIINKPGKNFLSPEEVASILPGSKLLLEFDCLVSESSEESLSLSLYDV